MKKEGKTEVNKNKKRKREKEEKKYFQKSFI